MKRRLSAQLATGDGRRRRRGPRALSAPSVTRRPADVAVAVRACGTRTLGTSAVRLLGSVFRTS